MSTEYIPAIFLALANGGADPLPALEEEEKSLTALFSPLADDNRILFHKVNQATVSGMTGGILELYDRLEVFHYGGHAGTSFLQLEGEDARAEGLARLLGHCPNLKLIVLNGCSTYGQVERLLALPNAPVVIATSAPVNDRAAAIFATAFYKTWMAQGMTLEKAYEAGVDAARVLKEIDTATDRGIRPIWKAQRRQPVWGIFSSMRSGLRWQFAQIGGEERNIAETFQPNAALLEQLPACLAPFSPEVRAVAEREEAGKKVSRLDKREALLRSLPYPVSEQIRKLLVRSRRSAGDPDADFFDQLDTKRVRQLIATYETALELLTFALLANLWETIDQVENVHVPEDQQVYFKQLFDLADEAAPPFSETCLDVIQAVGAIFRENDLDFFFREISAASGIFLSEGDFAQACRYLNEISLKLKTLGDKGVLKGAPLYCAEGELQLIKVINGIAFLGAYTIANVKDIGVLNYRHLEKPAFKHRLVRMIQRLSDLEEEELELDSFLVNASVLLIREEGARTTYLNLSPFVIDENAFDAKSPLPKLDFFQAYDQRPDSYNFKHAYKPNDVFDTRGKPEFSVIGEQFDQFAHFLFRQPLRSL